MKKNKLLVMVLTTIFLLPLMVNARENVSTKDALKEYFNSGGDVILTGDINFDENAFVNNELVLDLNGHTLNMTNKTIVPYKKLTVKDTSSAKTGNIVSTGSFTIQNGSSTEPGEFVLDSGTINANGSYGIRNYGKLTINNGTINGNAFVIYNQGTFEMNGGSIIAQTGMGVRNNADSTFIMNDGLIKINAENNAVNASQPGAKVIINGGTIEALAEGDVGGAGIAAFKDTEVVINNGTIKTYSHSICGNGSSEGANAGQNAKITVKGGTITSQAGNAIYAPQENGKTTILGGTLTSVSITAVEIRAGSIDIQGGVFNGNMNEYGYTEHPDRGSATIGAALAVSQHVTKHPIDVHICGGVFNAYLPLVKNNPLNNSPEDIETVLIDVGEPCGKLVFNATGDKPVEGLDLTKFIKGGIYSPDLDTTYVADGYQKVNADGDIEVTKVHNIIVNEASEDCIISIDDKSPYKNEVIINVKQKPNYEAIVEVRDASGNLIPVTNYRFIMPNSDVTVSVKYVKAAPKIVKNPKTATNYLVLLAVVLFGTYAVYYKTKRKHD